MLKNDDYRSVRSLRLTNSTWEALGEAAKSLSITKADLLENRVRNNDHFLPCITRQSDNLQPSITWLADEIERLKAEVQHLSKENALLVERSQKNSWRLPI